MINYWPNILLVLISITILLTNGKKIEGAFASFILYLTFHFSFPFSVILMGGGKTEYLQFREQHSSLPSLMGGAFLLLILLYIILRKKDALILMLKSKFWNKLIKFVAVLFSFLWLNLAIQQFNQEKINIVAFKNIISISILFVFSLIFSMLIEYKKILYKNSIILCAILVAVFTLALAYDEIHSNYAWAGDYLGNGRTIIRANSVFYNPNVMGIWFVFLGIWGLFLISKKRVFLLAHFLLFLSAAGIILSGSRSSFILIMIVIAFNAPILFLTKQSIRTTLIGSLSFLGQFGILCTLPFLNINIISDVSFQKSLQELALRFIELPYILFLYLSGSKMGDIYAPAKTSIEGRLLSGYGTDNAYSSILIDTGVIGLLIFCCLGVYILNLIVKTIISKPGINEIYCFSIFLTIVASGFMLRSFQVFPVWGMITVALSLILSQIAQNQRSKNEFNDNIYS